MFKIDVITYKYAIIYIYLPNTILILINKLNREYHVVNIVYMLMDDHINSLYHSWKYSQEIMLVVS